MKHVEYNPSTGATETWTLDEQEDSVTVRQEADVTDAIELNKKLQNEGEGRSAYGWNKDRDMVHVASIPPAIIMEWLQKFGVRAWERNHADAVKRLLNSNEYRYLRVNNLII